MTNSIQLIQAAAQHAGYELSGAEITALMALAGAAVHVAHQAVTAYENAGGWQGVIQFLKTGNKPKQQ